MVSRLDEMKNSELFHGLFIIPSNVDTSKYHVKMRSMNY